MCAVEECDRKRESKGLCKSHYAQVRKGQPLTPLQPRFRRVDDLDTFFWDRVIKSTDCWSWAGAKVPLGYGQIKFKGTVSLAHRHSYEMANGPIPEGGVIDHLCHNANCVNPGHLRLATHTQNMQNRQGATRVSSSGVRGVRWIAKSGRWRAAVTANGARHELGYFATLEEANVAVTNARRELHS